MVRLFIYAIIHMYNKNYILNFTLNLNGSTTR